MVELATHLGVQRGGRTNGSSRAALAGAFAALIACTLLAVTHRNSAMPTALTGWLATGHAGPIPFQVPPAEAAAQGVTSGEVSLPFHSSGANYGTGTAAHPLDGKGWNDEIPKYLMEPKWAARSGLQAAGHALAQPFLVPLEANGMPVASDPVTPLGEYAPVTPQYTNPLAQFIPNVTYVENGDVVYDDSAPEETSAPAEAATPAATAEDVPTPAAAAEAKQLSVMQTALRTVEAKGGSVQDLIRTLEAVDAKQQAKSKPQFVSQWAMLNKQQRNAQRIRAQMAQVAGHRSQMAQAAEYISPVYSAPASVTAGGIMAMKEADVIHQVNMRSPQTQQVQITTHYE